jgi:PKD repeat protein
MRRPTLHVEQLEHRLALSAAPVVDLGADRSYTEGDSAFFSPLSASDPDGDDSALVYEWDFNYDGTSFDTDAEGSFAFLDMTAPGTFRVALRVTDEAGDSTIDDIEVTVANALPFTDAGPDQTADQGQTIDFHGLGDDPVTAPEDLVYEWDLDYDGVTFHAGAAGQDLSWAYLRPGTYRVALRVSDPFGGSMLDEALVTVLNVAPTADAGLAQTIDAGDTASFHGTASDPGEPEDVLTYEWDFDYDGTTFDADAAGADVSRLFASAGTFRVALRVSDSFGGVTLSETTVTVRGGLPDLILQSVTTPNGHTQVHLTYRIEAAEALTGPVQVTLYATLTGVIDGNARALGRIALSPHETDLAGNLALTPGDHTVVRSTSALGFPGDSPWTFLAWQDYRLAARIDSRGVVAESDETNNDAVYSGVYRVAGSGRVLVQGTDGADEVTVAGDRRTLNVTFNGQTFTYKTACVDGITLRLHGGDDVLDAAGAPVGVIAWGGAGNDRLGGGPGLSVLLGGDGDDRLVGRACFDLLIGGGGTNELVREGHAHSSWGAHAWRAQALCGLIAGPFRRVW